jgi:hypothetical protein
LNKSEIIKQAKHFFGKDRTFIKERVLSYEFKGKNYRQWKKEIGDIIPNPNEIKFKLFDDVILWIKENKLKEIDWNYIGDLSWTIDIVLNPNIDKAYDWDKRLALKCNGTARILTIFISDILPCYTYDFHYMTYDKLNNYYEFGPLQRLTNEEKKTLKKVTALLHNKGLEIIDKEITQKKYKELYSDTNSDGNATLFDVLFTDVNNYTTDILRFCDKEIIEKNGQQLWWREYYNKNGTLKERIESRWTSSGDYLKVVLDNKGQITLVEVTRKKIESKKHENFKLDILETYKKRKKLNDKKKNRSNMGSYVKQYSLCKGK